MVYHFGILSYAYWIAPVELFRYCSRFYCILLLSIYKSELWARWMVKAMVPKICTKPPQETHSRDHGIFYIFMGNTVILGHLLFLVPTTSLRLFIILTLGQTTFYIPFSILWSWSIGSCCEKKTNTELPVMK